MRRLFTAWILALLALGSAHAEPVAACVGDTLRNYINDNVTCQVGDKIFSNFQFARSGGGAIRDRDVYVSPVSGDPFGLSFGPVAGRDWQARNRTNEVWLAYEVLVASPIMEIDRVLFDASVTVGNGGGAIVGKYLCAGASFVNVGANFDCKVPAGSLLSKQSVSGGVIDLSPNQTTLGVLDYVYLHSTANNRPTRLLSLTNRFDQVETVPEPQTYLLVGVGLVGLVVAGRRRRKKGGGG